MTVAAFAAALLVTASTTTATPAPAQAPPAPTLRSLGDAAGLRVGATLEPGQIGSTHSEVLAREFSSVTAENAMKWYTIQPERGRFEFAAGDAVLAFAEANGQEVRGHNLLWAQDQFTPAWVRAITDPDELRAVVHDHIDAVLGHYRGRIQRWDVVNEPLETLGTGPSDSVFRRVLGPGWLAEVLRYAHEVDPEIEIWLNEYGTDWVPGKHQAFLAVVRDLLDADVPLDGVGLQTHRLSPDGPDRATFARQLADHAALGLRIALTEVDVATAPGDPEGPADQAEAYRTIVATCLAQPACEEVTTWGISDADTWLDGQGILPAPTRPLLFDEAYAPKPAYDAVAAELAAGRPTGGPTSTTTAASTTTTTTTTALGAPPATPVAGAPSYSG